MDLRMKAVVLVVVLSYASADRMAMKMIDDLMGSIVQMRNTEGALTREGKMMHSLVFGLFTYMVMGMGRK